MTNSKVRACGRKALSSDQVRSALAACSLITIPLMRTVHIRFQHIRVQARDVPEAQPNPLACEQEMVKQQTLLLECMADGATRGITLWEMTSR